MSNVSDLQTQLGYPSWARKPLIAGLNPASVPDRKRQYSISCIPGQLGVSEYPSGWRMLSCLVPDTECFVAEPGDLIHRCVDISILRTWERRPSLIPSFCRGKIVGAWKSVFIGPCGAVYLPCLRCFGEGDTYVDYYILSLLWHAHEPILMEA